METAYREAKEGNGCESELIVCLDKSEMEDQIGE